MSECEEGLRRKRVFETFLWHAERNDLRCSEHLPVRYAAERRKGGKRNTLIDRIQGHDIRWFVEKNAIPFCDQVNTTGKRGGSANSLTTCCGRKTVGGVIFMNVFRAKPTGGNRIDIGVYQCSCVFFRKNAPLFERAIR